jgi:glutamate synthase domain-containing protein 3
VEGTGDHACEYMTAGAVVILGSTGRNLGAGMSGGIAYVLDEEGLLDRRYNSELVAVEGGLDLEEAAWLGQAIARHLELTNSPRARQILAGWSEWLPRFRRVVPRAGATRVLPAVGPEPEPLPELEPALPPRIAARRRIAARGAYARA